MAKMKTTEEPIDLTTLLADANKLTTKPQAAILLETNIEKKQNELSRLKSRSVDEVLAEEDTIAAYENRAPRFP